MTDNTDNRADDVIGTPDTDPIGEIEMNRRCSEPDDEYIEQLQKRFRNRRSNREEIETEQ